jgi:hypothetical protein
MLAALAHILKWPIFPILSYIWRLYGAQLLRYAWVRRTYGLYMFAHALIMEWVHRQEWYGRAHELKNRCVEGVRDRLVLAREAFRRWRVALRHRNTIFNIARLSEEFQVQTERLIPVKEPFHAKVSVSFLLSQTLLHARDNPCGFLASNIPRLRLLPRQPIRSRLCIMPGRQTHYCRIDPRFDREVWTYALGGAEIAGASGDLSRAVARRG